MRNQHVSKITAPNRPHLTLISGLMMSLAASVSWAQSPDTTTAGGFEFEGVSIGMSGEDAREALLQRGWESTASHSDFFKDFPDGKAKITFSLDMDMHNGVETVSELSVLHQDVEYERSSDEVEGYNEARFKLYTEAFGDPDMCQTRLDFTRFDYCIWTREVGDETQELNWQIGAKGLHALSLSTE